MHIDNGAGRNKSKFMALAAPPTPKSRHMRNRRMVKRRST
jgi:hypothetical protein